MLLPRFLVFFIFTTIVYAFPVLIKTRVAPHQIAIVTKMMNGNWWPFQTIAPSPTTPAMVTSTVTAHPNSPTQPPPTTTAPPSTSLSQTYSSSAGASQATPTTDLVQVVASTPQVGSAYTDTVSELWSRFHNSNGWNEDDSICNNSKSDELSLWDLAVLGKAIADTQDVSGLETTIDEIMNHLDSDTGAFSAFPNLPDQIFADDNGQILWVFIDAYKLTGNQKYLSTAEGIMKYLQTQNYNNTGGIVWQVNQNYIASISTVEAALAAVRLYEVNGDSSLIPFAEQCMNFMFKYLQDPSDHLFYDGLDKTAFSSVNKGKLTYTVGCAMSTLSLLYKHTYQRSFLNQAVTLAQAATNRNGAFYTAQKTWNNSLSYVHLLFVGFYDAFQVSSNFDEYKAEVSRQGNFVYQFLQDPEDKNLYFDMISASSTPVHRRYTNTFTNAAPNYLPDSSLFCNGNTSQHTKKSLMVNASAAQILYVMSLLS
ncbi:uncharacterized protein LODBEIA_P44990 [Lodderomyces beijingensis]|uniref:Alpha-1,6-mannanase n=1 Tax=Lodderomyces beijingensis TaxID=1775926 RepID=A0ABP0ZVD7_9ASCO